MPFEVHDSPGGQVPQLTACPHWFRITPHVSPSCMHVFAGGTHFMLAGSQ
jgi:hypothetical protein